MARQMLMMVWCALALGLLKPTDSALHVSPHTIAVDLTKSLEVNCTFSYRTPSNVSNLLSLIISKSDDHSNNTFVFKDLASIHEFTPDQVTLITPVNATVSGEISTVNTSYLSLRWAYSHVTVAGTYRCKALGVDRLGRSVEKEHTEHVTASNPSMNQLTEVVRLQQIQMDNVLNVLASLSGSLANVDNKLSTLNKTVSDGMKDFIKHKDILLTSLASYYVKSTNYQRRYYLLSKDELDTDREAQASCLLQGGYLAEINDASEHNFIKNFISSSAPLNTSFVLVGATSKELAGTFVFSHSDQFVNYTEWGSSTLRLFGPSCVKLARYDGSMAIRGCSTDRYFSSFLCEIPTS